ncbi:serine acetyltransferase [Halopseudomonas bauzanensis]|uniref:Serine acetyltransferase n=2 Tax=Halopseudomonas bauzanensis TaxID=653930 RepID=A0A4U0YNC2_9GAMM|nr:serine acetyltransferase [Halopseudomonas bauzanensis]
MNAIFLYRVAHLLHLYKIPVLPLVIKYLIFLIFNSVVPYSCKIGPGSKFAYGAIGVVLHSRCKIGKRVIIGQGVTIGRQLDPEGVPEIGDNVYISAGARVLGGIQVGDNVIIGANAVVVKDVPSNSIVAGVPAKVIKSVDVDIYQLLKNVY